MANEIFDIADAILNSGFEQSATITINNVATTISVIYQSEYERNNMKIMEYEGSNPIALADKDNVSGVKSNRDTIAINGTTFNIREVKPDNKNFVIMELSLD